MCLTRGSLLLRLHCDDSLVGLFHREIKLLCLLSLPVLWAVVSVSELFFRTLFFFDYSTYGTCKHMPHWPPEPGYIEVSCVEAAKIGVPDKGRHSILGDSGYLE